MLKTVGILFLLICAAARADLSAPLETDDPACASIKASPAFQSFVQTFVAAINSRNREALKACFHPKSLPILAKDKEYADGIFDDAFSDPIPAKYEVLLKALEPGDVTQIEKDEGTAYPVKPTVQMEIKWKLGPKGEEIAGGLMLISDGGKWYSVVGTRPTK